MEKFGKQKRYDHEHVDFLPYDKKNPAKRFKSKHAKPYRKRHISALTLFLILFSVSVFGLGVVVVRNAYQSRNLANEVSQRISSDVTLNSSFGFRFTFQNDRYDSTAHALNIDGNESEYTGLDLSTPRAYTDAELVANFDSLGRAVRYDNSKLTIEFDQNAVATDDLTELATRYAESSNSAFDIAKTAEEELTINGQTFLKQTFTKVPLFGDDTTASPVTSILYVANSYGHPIVVKLDGINETFTPVGAYEQVINSIVLENPSAKVLGAAYFNPNIVAGWLDPVKSSLRSFIGDTETPQEKQARLVATYSPAVVKIYHLVCGELIVNTSNLGYDCLTTTGSGFFISSDGYIGTSGHVASVSAKDVIVETMRSNPETIPTILKLLGYSSFQIDQTLNAIYEDPNAILSVMQQVYELPENTIRFSGQRDLYGVSLGNSPLELLNENNKPDIQIKQTQSVRSADLITADYNSADLVNTTFTGSDVAILKIDGSNYPVVQLGDVDLLAQGSAVTVIGYPAVAENELTDNNTLQATATDGVVSAVRNSNDGQHQIVQSDVAISGGNSGGPAFDEDGKVFGIATYIYESSDGGNTLSYMRDIQDLLDIAGSSGVKIQSTSTTQTLWEKGLSEFYGAHYTKAIDKFEEVLNEYPAHPLAENYIRISRAKIENGEEAKSSALVLWLAALAFVSTAGMVVMVVIIIRHNALHQHYKVAQEKHASSHQPNHS